MSVPEFRLTRGESGGLEAQTPDSTLVGRIIHLDSDDLAGVLDALLVEFPTEFQAWLRIMERGVWRTTQ